MRATARLSAKSTSDLLARHGCMLCDEALLVKRPLSRLWNSKDIIGQRFRCIMTRGIRLANVGLVLGSPPQRGKRRANVARSALGRLECLSKNCSCVV